MAANPQPTASSIDPQAIAQRAYELWEAEGRPDGRSEIHWREAEEQLREERERSGIATTASPRGRTTEPRAELHLHSGPEITNTDRALPVSERRRVRAERHETEQPSAQPSATEAPAPHFVVTLDRAHLRIYRANETGGPSGSQLQLEHAIDLPEGKESYVARDSDQAGRFGSHGMGPAGASIDERLPMQEEQNRRLADELVTELETFLRQHPRATWDFAAGPALHNVVLDHLSPETKSRLGTALAKDLVNQPIEVARDQFAPHEREPKVRPPRPSGRVTRPKRTK
jgi:hypothetical protein